MTADVTPTASATERHNPTDVPIPGDLVAMLESWRRPVVVGHVRPDADCLGSMCALALSWPGEGRRVAPISFPDGSLSQRLSFLIDWVDGPIATAADFTGADGFVASDTAKKSRCNVDKTFGDDWSAGRDIINIDHHASNTQFGRINWVDARAGSASELVYRLIRAADRPLTPLVASLLYAGIHSDTVGFSLATTTASALHAAAELVAAGARVAEIGEHLTRSQSKSEFDLNRVIHDNTRIVADGRIAYSTATYDEITGAGCTQADIDDQVGIPRCVRGIRLAILFTEGRPKRTRLNLRGEGGLDVLDLAAKFGGGGHSEAAGAILDANIAESVERVVPLAIEHIDRNGSQS